MQALKAGIMEIADIFVVNKADREGADRTVASIERCCRCRRSGRDEWRPPIVKTEATTGKGVPELLEAIEGSAHSRARLARAAPRRARAEWRLRELLAHRFVQHVERGARRRASSTGDPGPDRGARDRSVFGRR